jgi:hypothetical protein
MRGRAGPEPDPPASDHYRSLLRGRLPENAAARALLLGVVRYLIPLLALATLLIALG